MDDLQRHLLNDDCCHHLGVNRAQIFVSTRLGEFERVRLVLIQRARAKQAVHAGDRVRLAVQILPGHGSADWNVHDVWSKDEIFYRYESRRRRRRGGGGRRIGQNR